MNILPPVHTIWYEALGHQYLKTPPDKPGPCGSCGASGAGVLRTGRVLCPACWTLGAKKPMASRPSMCGPEKTHAILATADSFTIYSDLKPLQPLPAHVRIDSPVSIGLLQARTILKPPEPPFWFVQLDRAYSEVLCSARQTVSWRSVHLNGPAPLTVDAVAVQYVLDAMAADLPAPRDPTLAALPGAFRALGFGPRHQAAYASALTAIEVAKTRWPLLESCMPTQGQWLIAPDSGSWTALVQCLTYIHRGDLQR